MSKILLIAAAAATYSGTAAFAHVTLETAQAATGSTYKAVLRVPHGCDGKATTAVRVRLPEGFIGAKPMPKPGWKLETVSSAVSSGYMLHGAPVTETVTEIAWSGGSLPDQFYDEFVFRGTIADSLEAGTTLYFPVVQECDGAVERWIEQPAAGQDAHDLEKPAPGLVLSPKR